MRTGGGHESRDVSAGVLGEVEVRHCGVQVPLGHSRQRSVLAVLLVAGGQPVPVEGLVDRVWGEHAPARARAALRTYLSHLRQALTPTGITINRQDAGYLLTVDPETVDVHRFDRLHAQARRSDDPARALALVDEALALWRGQPLPELDTPWAGGVRERLYLERAAAEADRVDWALECGRHRSLIPVLTARAAEHPLDERVAGQLMLALYRDGRQADALEHYRRVRTRLVEELGVDPGAALRALHQRILAAEPVRPAVPAPTASTPVPRQLPAVPKPFVGRQEELDRLDAAFESAARAATALIVAVGGTGGIGKTWLALHWAHARRDRFPDGQLFVDLRGFSPAGDPVEPAAAVRGFLEGLGVESERIPVDLDGRAAMFRSLVADRRMLLLLDNAVDTAHVTPLLPGGESCTVVVTSRNRLIGLLTRHGAQHLPLNALPDTDARALLADRIGADPVQAERSAVDELIRSCGGFPLALSIVAAQATTRPDVRLDVLAGELRELGLDALDDGDPVASLPTMLSWSLRHLTAEQREAFALLGLAPGPDIGLPAAASLVGASTARTRKLLQALENASLLHRTADGRYAMHELVRDYAGAEHHLTESTRRAALDRVVDFYLRTAHAADRALDADRRPIAFDPPTSSGFADMAAALSWFDTEHAAVLAAQHTAAALGRSDAVWQMAWSLYTFHYRRGHHHANLASWQAALRAADTLPDPGPLPLIHRLLGIAHAHMGRHEEATRHLHQALTLAERHDDTAEQADTHRQLAWTAERRGDDRQALEHAELALDLYRALGQPVGEVRALNQVGWYAVRLGDYDTARTHCLAALDVNRRHYSAASEADILHSLGWIDHHGGLHEQAVGHYRRALTRFRELGDQVGVAGTLDHLADPCVALGRYAEAREAWQEALELYRRQGRTADAERLQRQLDHLA